MLPLKGIAIAPMAPNGRHLGCLALLLAARWSVGDEERRETGALISDGLAWEHSCRAEAGSSCASLGDDDDRFFADRLVRGALRVVEDPECQQGHALDAGGPGFSVLEASRIFRKCRVLVLRNAMDRGDVEQFRDALADHILALKNGTLSMKGSTTHGEDYFVFPLSNREDDDDDRDHARWLMLLPKTFAAPEIVAPPYLTQLLSHPRILGQDFVLNDAGVAIAERESAPQVWHKDDDYLFGEDALSAHGMAGHDYGSYSVTVMHPLLDIHGDRGPTEFCMGTSWLSGWNYDDHPKDETIVEALKDRTLMDTLLEYFPDPNDPTLDHCFFGKGRRVEHLNVTDVLLFDYQVKHRGGTNRSPDLRSLLYLTYARKWYKDTNFAPRASSDKARELDFVVGRGTGPLSTARKRRYAKVISMARFAEVAPGPNADAPLSFAPRRRAPALENISRPFAYDPSSRIAGKLHDDWVAAVTSEFGGKREL